MSNNISEQSTIIQELISDKGMMSWVTRSAANLLLAALGYFDNDDGGAEGIVGTSEGEGNGGEGEGEEEEEGEEDEEEDEEGEHEQEEDEEGEDEEGEDEEEEDEEGEDNEDEDDEEENEDDDQERGNDEEKGEETAAVFNDIDRTPVVKGRPEPAKLVIRLPNKDHPDDRTKDHIRTYRKRNQVDWQDHKYITAINRWRSQVFRRDTGIRKRPEGVPFHPDERQFIIRRFQHEPKVGLTILTNEFNAQFAGKQLEGCTKGPRPARTQGAIISECARNPEIRKARGKGEENMTERRREIREINEARKAKREAKKAKTAGAEKDED